MTSRAPDIRPNAVPPLDETAAPLLSVLICTYKNPGLVSEVLSCLSACFETGVQNEEQAWEALIIDNGQDAPTQALVAAHPGFGNWLRLEVEPRAGLSIARNAAARAARGRWLLFLDDDVTFEADFIASVLAVLRAEAPDILTGHMRTPVSPDWPEWLRLRLASGVGQYDLGETPQPLDASTKTPVGACFCIERSVFERFGPFREDLGRIGNKTFGGEETLLMRKAFRAGVRGRYDPAIRINHEFVTGKMSHAYWRRQAYFGGRSHVRMLSMDRGQLGPGRLFGVALRGAAMAVLRLGVALISAGPARFENRYRAHAHAGRMVEALAQLPAALRGGEAAAG